MMTFTRLDVGVIVRAVAAFLKVVRRRKSSSADGMRGGEHERGESTRGGFSLGGIPRENFKFSALLYAFLMGFYAFGARFQSRFFC